MRAASGHQSSPASHRAQPSVAMNSSAYSAIAAEGRRRSSSAQAAIARPATR